MNLSELGETEQEARLLPFRYLIPLQIPELFSQLSRHAFRAPSWLSQDCLEGYPLQQLLLFPGTSGLKLEPDLLSSPYSSLFPCLSEGLLYSWAQSIFSNLFTNHMIPVPTLKEKTLFATKKRSLLQCRLQLSHQFNRGLVSTIQNI